METLMVIALLLSLLNLVLIMTNMKRMKDDEERMNILDDVLSEVREREAKLDHDSEIMCREIEMLDKNRVVLAQAHNMLVGRVQALEAQTAHVDPADTAPEVNLFQEWIDRTDEAERRLEAQEPAHE